MRRKHKYHRDEERQIGAILDFKEIEPMQLAREVARTILTFPNGFPPSRWEIERVAAIVTAALTTHATAETWQPIESAPKDGTWVLLYTPEDAETGWLEFYAVSRFDKHGLDARYVHQWQDGLEPTHWQLLPVPPALAAFTIGICDCGHRYEQHSEYGGCHECDCTKFKKPS